MKTVLLLRHAKSSWKDENLPDHERPLNKRGQESAPRAGRWLRRHDLTPDLILSSTAVRAETTAEMAAQECGYEGEIELRPDLYSFEAGPYLKALAEAPDKRQRVMLVGHNPAMEELVQALTGEMQPMPTAAVACIRLPIERWSEIKKQPRGQLTDLWHPKEE
jgi:phosphohistidine phosphatase